MRCPNIAFNTVVSLHVLVKVGFVQCTVLGILLCICKLILRKPFFQTICTGQKAPTKLPFLGLRFVYVLPIITMQTLVERVENRYAFFKTQLTQPRFFFVCLFVLEACKTA